MDDKLDGNVNGSLNGKMDGKRKVTIAAIAREADGALRATEYLLRLGHRRIGFIAGPPQLLCSRARLDGYRTALEAAGLPMDHRLEHAGNFYHEAGR